MSIYTYQALTRSGDLQTGTLAADGPRQARDLLRERGLTVRKVSDHHSTQNARWFSRRRVSSAWLVTVVRELATLLSVGITLTEALDTLTIQSSGRHRSAMMLLRDRVCAGVSLAEAMEEQPHVFDRVSIQMVAVGESSGTLAAVLTELATFKEKSHQLKDRVLTALLYPAFVMCVSVVVSGFLMTVVVPTLLDNLAEAGRELPWPTLVLKAISDFLLNHGILLATILLFAALGLLTAARTIKGRVRLHAWILRLPIVGSMAQRQSIARVAFVMSTLMRSGVAYIQALDFAADSTKNVVIRQALLDSGKQVSAGQDIGHALAATNAVPVMVVQLFSVGQQSGQLVEMLDQLAVNYDRQVELAAGRLAAMLEPLMIVVLAAIVGFILFATMLPILEAGNVL